MTATLHARLVSHGIAVIGDVDLPADQAHAHLRDTLRKRHPAGMGSYVFWRRNAPDELHFSDPGVAAAVAAATQGDSP